MNGKIIWPKSRKTAPALEIPYFQRVSISVVQDISPSESVDSDGVPLVFITFLADYFCRFRLTQTVTHTGSRSGQDRRLPERIPSIVLAAWRWEAVVTWA